MRNRKAEIDTQDIKSKALEIAIGKGHFDFKASNGFVRCFKSRYNLHFKELHGDAGGVDSCASINWFQKLPGFIKDYKDEDIYNLDETGLLYKAQKGKSFVSGSEAADKNLRGQKKCKDRLTVLVGGSMSGEKLPLLVIGKSVKPYCFKHVRTLPTLYRSQISAWMDANLF